MRTLVIDNGAYDIKLNWAGASECIHVKNAIMRSRDRRLWLANAVDLCKDLIGLQYRRPIERGQLYSWELEKPIWDWIWDSKSIVEDPDEFKECALVLTETPGTLPSCSGNTDQIIFEEYEFDRYRRCPPQLLAGQSLPPAGDVVRLVVDVGYGATHVVPILNEMAVYEPGIRRLDVGGRTLTNYLKETISYRYYNMMEETAILNRVKELACYASLDFNKDLEKWHKQHLVKPFTDYAFCYALPTTPENPYGHVEPSIRTALEAQRSGREQILVLENERFSVPEALFDPVGHLGIEQAPLPEIIADSIASCPTEYQPLLWSNIVVAGGTFNMENLTQRLIHDLQRWTPSDVPMKLFGLESNRSELAWRGGARLCSEEDFDLNGWTIGRSEYLEQGPAHTMKKMAQMNRWG